MPPKAKLHKDKGKLKSIPPLTTIPSASTVNPEDLIQFEVELLWCIQQLQSTLNSGKLNPKQTQDTTKVLNSLMNNSTPLIKKRQLMRLTFGDYRAKMAEEEAKYLKKNEKITYVPTKPNKKSVFVKKAPFLTSGKDFKFNFDVPKEECDIAVEENLQNLQINESELNKITEETKNFHYQPSNNTFRFNFVSDNKD